MILLALALWAMPQDVDPHLASLEANIARPRVLAGVEAKPKPLATRMEELGVPGVSVAFIDEGEVVWARGWGYADVESKRPVTPETLFQAASISKPVAALGALTLVDEGRLTLDGSINEQLESWSLGDEEHVITLRGLMTHTAGLTVHGFPGYTAGVELPSTLEVLQGRGNTGEVKVDLVPGTQWRYSGGGYTVMQLLMEEVSGRPFATLMRERVLVPMGMERSTYEQPLPEARRSEAATAYSGRGDAVEGRFHSYPEQAAAGLWTTPSDLARYLIAAQSSLSGGEHPILEEATAEDMLTPALGGWGLGPSFFADGAQFGHGGANMGFRCQMLGLVEGNEGAVVMTNSDSGGALAQEILMTLAREYGWDAPRSDEIAWVRLSDAERAALVGSFVSEEAGTIELSLREDALWATSSWDGESERLWAESTKRLYTSEATRLYVRYGKDGVPAKLIVSGQSFSRVD